MANLNVAATALLKRNDLLATTVLNRTGFNTAHTLYPEPHTLKIDLVK
jgi:hypothetical protein